MYSVNACPPAHPPTHLEGELVRNLSAEGFLVAHLVSLPNDPLPDSSGQGGSSEGSVFGAASGDGGSPMRQADLMGARVPEFKKQSYMGICRLGPNGTARRIDIKTCVVSACLPQQL